MIIMNIRNVITSRVCYQIFFKSSLFSIVFVVFFLIFFLKPIVLICGENQMKLVFFIES